MIMERPVRNSRAMSKLYGVNALGDDDTYDYLPANDPVNFPQGVQTTTFDDGSTITYDAAGNVVSSTNATDLPMETAPAGTVLQTLLSDPGKLIKIGTQIYRYYRTQNAQGQFVYQPLPYYGTGTSMLSNPIMLLALAAGAFLLLS